MKRKQDSSLALPNPPAKIRKVDIADFESTLFAYCSYASLLRCEQVCRRWWQLAQPVWKKHVLRFYPFTNEMRFVSWKLFLYSAVRIPKEIYYHSMLDLWKLVKRYMNKDPSISEDDVLSVVENIKLSEQTISTSFHIQQLNQNKIVHSYSYPLSSVIGPSGIRVRISDGIYVGCRASFNLNCNTYEEIERELERLKCYLGCQDMKLKKFDLAMGDTTFKRFSLSMSYLPKRYKKPLFAYDLNDKVERKIAKEKFLRDAVKYHPFCYDTKMAKKKYISSRKYSDAKTFFPEIIVDPEVFEQQNENSEVAEVAEVAEIAVCLKSAKFQDYLTEGILNGKFDIDMVRLLDEKHRSNIALMHKAYQQHERYALYVPLAVRKSKEFCQLFGVKYSHPEALDDNQKATIKKLHFADMDICINNLCNIEGFALLPERNDPVTLLKYIRAFNNITTLMYADEELFHDREFMIPLAAYISEAQLAAVPENVFADDVLALGMVIENSSLARRISAFRIEDIDFQKKLLDIVKDFHVIEHYTKMNEEFQIYALQRYDVQNFDYWKPKALPYFVKQEIDKNRFSFHNYYQFLANPNICSDIVSVFPELADNALLQREITSVRNYF